MGTRGTAHVLNQTLNEDLREDWTCYYYIIIIIIIIYIYNGVYVCIYMMCMPSVSAASKVFNYFK